MKLNLNVCSFTHFISVLLLHYLEKCRSCNLAVYLLTSLLVVCRVYQWSVCPRE